MASTSAIVYPLIVVLMIIHISNSLPTDKTTKKSDSKVLPVTTDPLSRQDYGNGNDPLIPGEEESESTEAPLPGILGRAREGLQRFRENAGDFWEGVQDRISDWFDTD